MTAIIRHRANAVPLKKNATAPSQETSFLMRWSMQEIRRIAMKLAQRRIQHAHIIAWSLWRRAHQAEARRDHLKTKSNCNATPAGRGRPALIPRNDNPPHRASLTQGYDIIVVIPLNAQKPGVGIVLKRSPGGSRWRQNSRRRRIWDKARILLVLHLLHPLHAHPPAWRLRLGAKPQGGHQHGYAQCG
jgi:hypothetical protein